MFFARRYITIVVIAIIFLLLFYYQKTDAATIVASLPTKVPQAIGLGDWFDYDEEVKGHNVPYGEAYHPDLSPTVSATASMLPSTTSTASKLPGSKYTRNLVMAKMRAEDVSWLNETDLGPNLNHMIYIADDRKAPLHPPKNKGNEVMTYLTYIIDFYDQLPDVTIFMHSHRLAWHNNELLNFDAAEMIKRLSNERVERVGYMNMRCHWFPGCPDWIYPGKIEPDRQKLEQSMIADAWSVLFPDKPIPQILAQSCCSQFAVSRDKIRETPREKYMHYRDWLLHSPIRDSMTGRVFEYLWQVIFTGEAEVCPDQRACYCDGFGVCFENHETFDKWFEIRWNKRQLELELAAWKDKAEEIEKYRKGGMLDGIEAGDIQVPAVGKDEELTKQIQEMNDDLEARRLDALERGVDPRVRAESAGRAWKPGDGF